MKTIETTWIYPVSATIWVNDAALAAIDDADLADWSAPSDIEEQSDAFLTASDGPPDDACAPPPECRGLDARICDTIMHAPAGCRIETRTGESRITWPLARGGESRAKSKPAVTVPAEVAPLFARVSTVRGWWELLHAARAWEWLRDRAEAKGCFRGKLRPRHWRSLQPVFPWGAVSMQIGAWILSRDGDLAVVRAANQEV